ncbi:DUF3822 family protein [Paludibacter sp. 221]|uniref:DUF3822 family protein n=1 Tax=Paludibacter sp. 221 TaxID=2302939 RepID=UPI0013D11993|nr:DUF3822 family protein [Paludibacter sp. 221]NDV46161.1 DUF3822 family protein [Paludibacter sp. 221]
MDKSDLNKRDYSLSIRCSPDGFSLFILEQGNVFFEQKIHAPVFHVSSEEIKQLLSGTSEINLYDYNEMQVHVESDKYVFLPESTFKPRYIDDYYYFQYDRNKEDIVLFNRTAGWDMVNVFSIPFALHQALNELFPETIIRHHLSYFLSEKIKSGEDGVYVWVRAKMLDVVVVRNSSVVLINSFSYRTPEDFTYYILSVFEQLRLDVENTKVKLYQRNNTTEFQSLISDYVRNCKVILQ